MEQPYLLKATEIIDYVRSTSKGRRRRVGLR